VDACDVKESRDWRSLARDLPNARPPTIPAPSDSHWHFSSQEGTRYQVATKHEGLGPPPAPRTISDLRRTYRWVAGLFFDHQVEGEELPQRSGSAASFLGSPLTE